MNRLDEYVKMWDAIRSALSHGGYIKVRNGELCCDGDHVLCGIANEVGGVKEMRGILRWDMHDMMFYIHTDFIIIPAFKTKWIEKVKEE